jgi:hypothetical protein
MEMSNPKGELFKSSADAYPLGWRGFRLHFETRDGDERGIQWK